MTLALAFIDCESEFNSTVQDAINQVKGVIEVHILKDNGIYDVVVKIETEDETKFKDVIVTLKSIAGIRTVQVNIVYESSVSQKPL
jgi:nitrate reductase NapAB chaperone NapD